MADETDAAAKDAACALPMTSSAGRPSRLLWRNIYLTGAKELRDGVGAAARKPAGRRLAQLANLPGHPCSIFWPSG